MIKKKPRLIVGLGELLWDIFPTGKHLGGAPANFAYNINCLGDQGIVATAVGNDLLGREIIDRLKQINLSVDYLQNSPQHLTGIASVKVNAIGQPVFKITEKVAWDFLEWTPEWEKLALSADAVCFGSLSQRSEQSYKTIQYFLETAKDNALSVFDVNIRQPYCSSKIVLDSLKLADVVKLNSEELDWVAQLAGLDRNNAKSSARKLMRSFQIQLICVTRGASGSWLVSLDDVVEHSGFPVKVVDTVGSGDAFTAMLTYLYLRGKSLEMIGEAGNRLGSWVASKPGATPPETQDMARKVLQMMGCA